LHKQAGSFELNNCLATGSAKCQTLFFLSWQNKISNKIGCEEGICLSVFGIEYFGDISTIN
jgi:hypothetical protein